MLITFKSDADGDIIMFGEVGQRMLTVLGKDAQDPRGIVTQEQLPAAIAALQGAMEEDKARSRKDTRASADNEMALARPIGLATRALPLLNMLQHALRDKVVVTWESS